MSREEYHQYLEILELGPDASLAEIKKSYIHLKRLYSTESIVISPIAEEFPEEKRKEILEKIEESYRKLLLLLEKEDKKILKKEKKIQFDIDKTEKEEKTLPYIKKMLKQVGSILEAKDLQKSYSKRLVVKGVDLEVRSG